MGRRPRPTTTSAFGVGRRESHDSTGFYRRFAPPTLSTDDTVLPPGPQSIDRIHLKDARNMEEVERSSVALVVTSPPYFAGKEYEEALGEGHIPATYLDYLELLHDVFKECADKLQPGGRLAVNVANLGRKPYRSLSSDVITVLQDRLGLLLRGEIIWVKGKGASGSTAWGSFQSPANPVLRDLTERVIVASKGRFDRALSRRTRTEQNLPSEVSIFKDEFMDATTDVWEFAPESAHRVGHPAPFPVELPQRLIELYTYRGDLVLDPFVGSGSTAVAAIRTGRTYVGYDNDAGYVRLARARADEELRRQAELPEERERVTVGGARMTPTGADPAMAEALKEGRTAIEVAVALLQDCGFVSIREHVRVAGGIEFDLRAEDQQGRAWLFDVCGTFSTSGRGLKRTESLFAALGKAAVLHSADEAARLVFLTTDMPVSGSAGESALRAARGKVFLDAIDMLSGRGRRQLRAYAAGGDPGPT